VADGSTQLESDIEAALQRLAQREASPFDMEGYIAAFQASAVEKAKTVLKLLDGESPFAGFRPAFLSIGGGDGEELRHLLRESRADLGALIEASHTLAERARDQRNTLAVGKRFEVFEGDAQERLREGLKVVRKEVAERRADFVAVTCHAVIHELFDRGKRFDPLGFFGAIFNEPEVATWFTYREPGKPEKWPTQVLVQADCSPKALLRLAEEIASRHPSIRELSPRPDVIGDSVRLHPTAAMELLAKLFYLSDLAHEIEERSTAVDHDVMQSYLLAAMGERAEGQQLTGCYPMSEPTRSFIERWTAHKVRVRGLTEEGREIRLSIPESQTRVIAWRLTPAFRTKKAPPLTVPARGVSPPDPALTVAVQAHIEHNRELLAALLVSHGRWLIESPDKDAATQLLEAIRADSPPASLPNLWSHYLLSISSLFKEPGEVPADAFSPDKERDAEGVGLGELFQAERMEVARKRGDRGTALDLANALRREITAGEALPPKTGRTGTSESLARYAAGTNRYLLANLLRSGGRYDLAQEWIAHAEAIFQRGIPSHDTELAHCHYARQVCTAVMGRSEFAPLKDEGELLSRRFSGALILLSYSHAAWFVDEIDRAFHHAERAVVAFEAVDADRYVQRAEQLQRLLRIWKALGSSAAPTCDDLGGSLAEAIRYLSGQQPEWAGLSDWLAGQRPSTAVGLLQFAKRVPAVWNAPGELRLPPTIEVSDDGSWRWSDRLSVASLAQADMKLRELLSIPADRRIPLIAD
jgi:hypothetical protein